jgi:sulfur-oxidizing protein SoxY
MTGITRRAILAGAVALAAGPAFAQAGRDPTLSAVFGDRRPRPGKVALKAPPIAESGNSVPVTVSVDEAPARVRRIVLVAPGNPFPLAAEYRFGPRAARPEIATRLRLARSQTVTAVAELADGSLWSASAEVAVTLGACVEGEV